MPRLVRRKPLLQRVSAFLNPMDTLLWLFEELETRDWDSKQLGTQLGLGFNILFLLGRANYGSTSADDDVFGDDDKGSSWISLVIFPLVWGLVIFSFTNAFYTVTRKRKYRLFEANIDVQPASSSARRVSVQSSSANASPLHLISKLITPETAESRAHPDRSRDVWELAIWDPLPVSLRILCLFSPGHVLVYLLFLPLAPLEPRPSITVFNTLLVQALLSSQMLLLCSRFSQQARDNGIIQKEVMHEYDAKFVHPLTHPIVRDVGVQAGEDVHHDLGSIIETGTPTTLIRRSFKTNGNPYFEASTDHHSSTTHTSTPRPQLFTPSTATRKSDTFVTPATSFRSQVLRSSLPGNKLPISMSTNNLPFTTSSGTNPSSGQPGTTTTFGHPTSPLKKTISLHNINADDLSSPRFSRESSAYEASSRGQPSSPIKPFDIKQSSRKSFSTGSNQLSQLGRPRPAQPQDNPRPRW